MLRRLPFRLLYLLGSLLVFAASLHPATAYSAPGDPPSGSPAGAVYQLPLEQGRSDAAPKGGGGTSAQSAPAAGVAGTEGGGDSGSSESGSLYRTENNFGSSSRVPGLAASGAAAGGSTAQPGNSGTDAAGTAGAAVAGGAIASEASDTGNTSVAAGAVLLGAIALLAVGVGLLSRRFSDAS